jgi:hypothetical protein
MTGILAQTGNGIAGPPYKMRQNETPYWLDVPFADRFNNQLDSLAYNLTYAFAGPVATPVTLTATSSATSGGNGWNTTFSAIAAAKMIPGIWYWQAILTAILTSTAPARIVAAEGKLIVEPDLSTLTGIYDGRSTMEIGLATWEAAYAAITGSNGSMPVKQYTIGNRHLEYQDLKEIREMIDWFRARVGAEKSAASGGDSRMIRVGFSKPSSGSQVSNSRNWPWW